MCVMCCRTAVAVRSWLPGNMLLDAWCASSAVGWVLRVHSCEVVCACFGVVCLCMGRVFRSVGEVLAIISHPCALMTKAHVDVAGRAVIAVR